MAARCRAAHRSSPRRPRGRRRSLEALRTVSARAYCSPARGSLAPHLPSRPAVERGGGAPPRPGVRNPAERLPFCAGKLRRYLRVPLGSDHTGRVDVDGPHVGARRRLDDVLGEAASGIISPLELHRDPDLAEGVLSPRYGVDTEIRQPALYVRCGVDCAEDRVDGPLTFCFGLEGALFGVGDGDGGPALAPRGGDDPERLEDELAFEGADLVRGDSLQVGGCHGLLVVRYLLETREGPLEHIALHVVAELFQGVLEGVAARVLAEEDVRSFQADVFLGHDLEGAPVLEHAILVDARLVQKGVAPHDGLVRGDLVARDVGDHAARVGELAGLDADPCAVVVRARGERHHDLLQRGIPCPLTDAVDSYLDLAGPDLDPCERVGDGHPEVVVAVDREDALLECWHPLPKLLQEICELDRRRVAYRVGDVDHVGPCLDGRGDDLGEVAYVRARRVHRGELDVLAEVLGEGHRLAGPPQDVFPVGAHLVLYMQVAGAYESVDAWPLCPLHSLPGTHDVLLVDAGEACDPRSFDLRGDAAHRLEVSLGGDREPGLYYVHLQAGELAGYLYLLFHGQGDPWRLLAVAECGVEDLYSTHVSRPPTFQKPVEEKRLGGGGRGQPARYRGW